MNQDQEEKLLLQEICKEPAENAPRFGYADWLRDHGDPDRADFIYGQIILDIGSEAGVPLTAERREELQRQTDSLLRKHEKEWTRPLTELGAASGGITFHRGFPNHAGISVENFLENSDKLFQVAPITSLRIREWADHRTRGRLYQNKAKLLANTPHLSKLTALDLGDNRIDDAAVQELAQSPHLANLTSLGLGNNFIGSEGARALAESPHLANLNSLDLGYNNIGVDGTRALAESPHLANLTSLELGSNNIENEGVQTLAQSPNMANLTSLGLERNNISNGGIQALAQSPNMANLTSLQLNFNLIDVDGAQALVQSPRLPNLKNLDLYLNHVGNAVLNEIKRTLQSRHTAQGQGGGVSV